MRVFAHAGLDQKAGEVGAGNQIGIARVGECAFKAAVYADLGQPGDLGVHVEEARDPTGRRGVEHDRVVDVPAVVVAPAHRLGHRRRIHVVEEDHVEHPLLEREQFVADYRLRSTEYGLDVGRELANWGEVRAGVRSVTGHTRLRLGDPSLKGTDFEAREYYTRFSYDTLDDRNFPRQGQSLRVEWRGERRALGSDRDADVATVDWLAARSQGRDTAVLWTSFGTNIAADASNVRTLLPLGGFLNLSGLPRDAISGRH